MKQLTSIAEIADYLKNQREKGVTTGFVPTMGALHAGHLDLVKRSKRENDLTVCSIFVNPIQFNNQDDLAKYPRTLARDSGMLEESGCDLLFVPQTEEMYPEGEVLKMGLDFGMLGNVMEGKFRPGHFNGVAIVVKKLFDIIHPTRSYFGKKDFQQLAIIKFMVEKLNLPVEIIPCDTVREPDGLAMSSRNARLTQEERALAPKIYQVLKKIRERYETMPYHELKAWAITEIQKNPGFRVEYVEIGDKATLLPVTGTMSRDQAVAFVAVFAGEVRLIDNIELFS